MPSTARVGSLTEGETTQGETTQGETTQGEMTEGEMTGLGVRTIDCAECVMAGTGACADCVVTFVVGRAAGDALIIDADVERDIRLLGSAGLVPDCRHRRTAG